MRSKGERRMIVLAVALSLVLTALTVWAVDRQGNALVERERADLQNAAEAAASSRTAAFRASLERVLDVASLAWERLGAAGLEAWVVNQREWPLAGCLRPDGTWLVFPRTPLEEQLPDPGPDDVQCAPDAPEDDQLRALERLRELAETSDPMRRAAALFAVAACEQQMGHPLTAARILSEAAALLRASPGLGGVAFRAELERIEALAAAEEYERARETLRAVVERLRAGHPLRVSSAEVARLRRQARLLQADADKQLAVWLDELERRAVRRRSLTTVVGARVRERSRDAQAEAETSQVLTARSDEALIVGTRRLANGTWLAVAVPVAELVERYWSDPGPQAEWRVERSAEAATGPILVQLGRAFGYAVLTPSEAALERLGSMARRRLGMVVVTALGTAGAWVLVIWVLSRVLTHQRELVQLQRRFVADVSHELKTPLALIRLLAETLADQRVRDPERVRNYLETITRESERLSVLLDGILDFSRIDSGRKQYRLRDCDVRAVAHQAWALFEPQFNSEQFDARLEVEPELPIIQADAQALQQVMVNLLQNAYRYAGDGRFVRLRAAREGYLIVITVEDHGIGMTKKQLERLGDSFVRGEDTRVRQVRGAGLGLAIVHHIVNAHRGKLEVQSSPGKGSTFTVWIPYQPAELSEP